MVGPKSDLHVLDGIEIAKPCCIPWEEIQGSGRIRSCHVCRKDVFDLIELTTAEAAQLLAQDDELPCIRICRGPDGRIMTADNPAGLGLGIWRWLRRRSGYAASLFGLLFIPGCSMFNSVCNSFLQYGSPARSIKPANAERPIAEDTERPKVEVAKDSTGND